jgi:DNA polymerase I-like protein with 3'-5' exonuclease and polymerase domains
LDKKLHRGSAKTANFTSAYGGQSSTIAMRIEAETGVKPEIEDVERFLEMIEKRQPVSTVVMKKWEDAPKDPGYMVAASGRRRHFSTFPDYFEDEDGMSYMYRSSLSAAGREARNFYCQESVAATSSRAAIWLTKIYRKCGMRARIIAVLYDSIVTLCPWEERFLCEELHQRYMCDANTWNYDGRILKYPIDTEFNISWSYSAKLDNPELAAKLEDRTWRTEECATWLKVNPRDVGYLV